MDWEVQIVRFARRQRSSRRRAEGKTKDASGIEVKFGTVVVSNGNVEDEGDDSTTTGNGTSALGNLKDEDDIGRGEESF
ncbi:hypothetical protein AN958_00063 [Leucoagaricus sp. SymC.cos]|nr:hypothetical protein AN958_00063 [Leucoagaricus sp. SymC.cos]